MIICGRNSVNNVVEFKVRTKVEEKQELPVEQVISTIVNAVKDIR